MSRDSCGENDLGFETFGTASGLAVVAGALSVVAPTFDVLTETLVALALAGWASLHRRAGRPFRLTRTAPGPYVVAFALLAVAGVVFLDAAGSIAAWRALVLGLGLVPLWLVERRGSPALMGTGRSR